MCQLLAEYNLIGVTIAVVAGIANGSGRGTGTRSRLCLRGMDRVLPLSIIVTEGILRSM